MIDTLIKDYRIDTAAIFVGGYSSGGFMSYRFGLKSKRRIKGIASVAGLLQSDDGSRPAKPIELISFHSTADAVVPYYGTFGYYGAIQSVSQWLNYNSCGPDLTTEIIQDLYPNNANTVERLFSACSPVVFYRVTGGSHAWPGPYSTGHRPTIPDVNATLEIMKFCKSQIPVGTDKLSQDKLPNSFRLSQNYPNPFNPSTVISYQLPVNSKVSLKIYDLLGREIATLVNEEQSAGWKQVEWNATSVASGIYFYKLQANNFIETKKMLVIK